MAKKGKKEKATLEDVLEILLDRGTAISADIPVVVGDVEVLSLKIQPLLLASFDTARQIGLEIPSLKKENKDEKE